MSVPMRSDIPLASAERLAASGRTDEEAMKAWHRITLQFWGKNIVVVNLNDQSLTISQHDRLAKLGREIAQVFEGGK